MQHLTETQWSSRFVTRLGELLPWVSARDAERSADDAYPDTFDLEPEDAAEIYVDELPPLNGP